jgi:hypothetical protein
MQNKQKTKKQTPKNRHNKKSNNQGKFRKAAPESKHKAQRTQKEAHIKTSKNEITKVINKSIEQQMMQRARTGNEQMSVLKS